MEEKVVRKTTAKKTVRRVTASVAAPARATVRKATESSSVRKAPPRISQVTTQQKRGSSFKVISIGVVLFAILVGVSALIGLSDKGQLDVASAIAERKAKATPEEKQALDSVPTQQTQNNTPNGGLVGMGQEEPKAPVVEQVSTTTDVVASSSDVTASTTSEASEETPTATGG